MPRAEEIIVTARHELALERKRLEAPAALTTEAGLALAAVQTERRAAERAARAEHLRSLPDLATAEIDLKGNA